MELGGTVKILVIQEHDLAEIHTKLDMIQLAVAQLRDSGGNQEPSIKSDYITAKEFMKAVGIKRTRFYNLIALNKIKTIKKSRHIHVLASEVERYFKDPSI